MQADIAIVLRASAYQERDRLVCLLTEHHGKITGIAKGAIHSRRFGGSFDLFNCIHINYVEKSGRELVRIEEASIKRDFPGIRSSLERITAAGYFADLCLRLSEDHEPARNLFVLLAHYLFLLEKEVVSRTLLHSFEIKLLDRLGYSPILHQCVQCETKIEQEQIEKNHSFGFSIERGGIVCSDCYQSSSAQPFSRESLLWNLAARQTPITQITGLYFPTDCILESASIWKNFLRFHCPGLDNYQFRSQSLLEEILQTH